MSARVSSSMSGSAMTSETAKRPPGLSTRAASASTLGLSAERLSTQLDTMTSTDASASGMSSMKPFRNCAFATPAAAALARARSSISSVMSRPMAFPVEPTRRALMSTSAPAPEPRSSTVSPSCRSATAVGTPQPRDACTALAVAPSTSAPSYSAAPNTCARSASVSAMGPQHSEEADCSATARAAAAYFSRTVSRMSGDPVFAAASPSAQPHPSPARFSPQQSALSDGSQQPACASGEQHGDVVVGWEVSSAMRSAPWERRGNGVVGPLVAALDGDQAGVDELLDVVRQQRLADVEQSDQLALAHVLLAAAQHVEDVDANRLGERPGDGRDALRVKRRVQTSRRCAACLRGGSGRRRSGAAESYQSLLLGAIEAKRSTRARSYQRFCFEPRMVAEFGVSYGPVVADDLQSERLLLPPPRTRLNRARRLRLVSQRSLSLATGISERNLGRLENGEIENPPLRYLVNCAYALGIEDWRELVEPE